MDEELFSEFTMEARTTLKKLGERHIEMSLERERSGGAKMVTVAGILAFGQVPEKLLQYEDK